METTGHGDPGRCAAHLQDGCHSLTPDGGRRGGVRDNAPEYAPAGCVASCLHRQRQQQQRTARRSTLVARGPWAMPLARGLCFCNSRSCKRIALMCSEKTNENHELVRAPPSSDANWV